MDNSEYVDLSQSLSTNLQLFLNRYVSMALLQKEKEEILTRHITEALYPPTDNWGAKCLAEALKSQRARLSQELPNNKLSSPSLRWQLKPDSETLNVVLLGANGLSRELANEITVSFCVCVYFKNTSFYNGIIFETMFKFCHNLIA